MTPRLTFLLDVDNTLLDNDAAKEAIDARLRALLGQAETSRFWSLYEVVRSASGVVSYPLTLARFNIAAGPDHSRQIALAELLMTFPYHDYIYPGALDTLAALRHLGQVAILSDGDPTYQPSKIARSGLADAVGGYVLVYPHKHEHLDEITAIFPADHFVMVEDHPDNLTRIRARCPVPLTAILVRQGKYAAAVGAGPWPGADITTNSIADLAALTAHDYLHARHRQAVTP
jgi:FMN phosphatase YigB (HAD superfamily)